MHPYLPERIFSISNSYIAEWMAYNSADQKEQELGEWLEIGQQSELTKFLFVTTILMFIPTKGPINESLSFSTLNEC